MKAEKGDVVIAAVRCGSNTLPVIGKVQATYSARKGETLYEVQWWDSHYSVEVKEGDVLKVLVKA